MALYRYCSAQSVRFLLSDNLNINYQKFILILPSKTAIINQIQFALHPINKPLCLYIFIVQFFFFFLFCLLMISSMGGHRLIPGLNTAHFYGGTKHMVTALTEGYRDELLQLKSQIRVSVSYPLYDGGRGWVAVGGWLYWVQCSH